jgi:hypothetical protein
LAATRSRRAARLSGEPEREFSARVFFAEQVDGGPHRGDRSKEFAEQLVSAHSVDLRPVVDQSAFATLGTLDEDLTGDWAQLCALVLITQAHDSRLTERRQLKLRADYRRVNLQPHRSTKNALFVGLSPARVRLLDVLPHLSLEMSVSRQRGLAPFKFGAGARGLERREESWTPARRAGSAAVGPPRSLHLQ